MSTDELRETMRECVEFTLGEKVKEVKSRSGRAMKSRGDRPQNEGKTK